MFWIRRCPRCVADHGCPECVQIQANLVADILNTIQNLYQLANKREIAKIQDEFYQIYKAEDLDQLRRFRNNWM